MTTAKIGPNLRLISSQFKDISEKATSYYSMSITRLELYKEQLL